MFGLLNHLNKLVSVFGFQSEDFHLRELLRGSAVAMVLRIAGIGATYLFTLLVTRAYGGEAMGIFALCLTVLQMSSVVGRLGTDTMLLRFAAEYTALGRKDLVKEVYIKALKRVIPFGLFLSVLLFFLSPYIAKSVFHKEHLAPYFRIVFVAIVPMILVFMNSEGLRGLRKIKEYIFLQNIAAYLLAAVFLMGTLLFWRAALAPLLAYICALFLVSGIGFAMWLKHVGLTRVADKDNARVKNILSVSLPMLLASSLMLVMQWTDNIMLGMWRTETDVGIYNIALKVAAVTSITLFAINSIAAPKFAAFYGRGDMKGLGRIVRQSTKMIFWTSFPILAVTCLFPSFILGVFGEEFRSGTYALILLAMGQFINSISGSVGYILQMTGKQKIFQNIILCATVINIVLNAILIPPHGINGAAFASMVSMGVWNLSSVLYVKKALNISTMFVPLLKA